jgi:tetratricopeptide (TPR) repeat protein
VRDWSTLGDEIVRSLPEHVEAPDVTARVRWCFSCPHEDAAWRLAEALEPDGYGCYVDLVHNNLPGSDVWICHAMRLMPLQQAELNALGPRLERLAMDNQCEFEGWNLEPPDPTDCCPAVRAFAGAKFYEQGEHRFAVALLGETLGRDAELDRDMRPILGLAYSKLKRWGRAEAMFRRAVEDEPNEGPHHVNLGNAVLEQGRHLEAIACFEAALRLNRDDGDAHYNLACVAARTGDTNAALEHLASAIGCEGRFRKMAANDADFAALHAREDFQDLTRRKGVLGGLLAKLGV